ncbi:hypothetical protein B9J09_04375 [Xylella fastidiosa subsp. pauca]|uniref:Uncharacterized protein n=1 Tax=Xylella fastidiosa (strain 9a5c) TaxID=160492 RepID=Q9PBN8_XYLFA|nr:hypothetical protein XF_2102 [Xylella fastidiosa 9a5c]ARO68376.1 hypothetical protein B9J09_04375 [Xylella fastidiosa subsp. pauca]TNW23189.1 hypothetical protein EIP73_10175 [Xylella fastidiosa subsp. pauca]TNW25223.1 hypothetical protein EIP74_01445 [Xylella fastidiosa subsp. pauca]
MARVIMFYSSFALSVKSCIGVLTGMLLLHAYVFGCGLGGEFRALCCDVAWLCHVDISARLSGCGCSAGFFICGVSVLVVS